jgi:hypothetical protein
MSSQSRPQPEIEKLDQFCATAIKNKEKLEKIIVKNEKELKAIVQGIKECQGFADWIEKIIKDAQRFAKLKKFTIAEIRAVKASFSAKEFKKPTTTNGLRHAVVATKTLLECILAWYEKNKDKLDPSEREEIKKLVTKCREAIRPADDHIKTIDDMDERIKAINDTMENVHSAVGDFGKMVSDMLSKEAQEDLANEITGVRTVEIQLPKTRPSTLETAVHLCSIEFQITLVLGILGKKALAWRNGHSKK